MHNPLSADAPPAPRIDARQFFLEQHSFVHAIVDGYVLAGLSDEQLRQHPAAPSQNALAFLLWHAARWEDVIVNVWLLGAPQVFDQTNWQGRLHVEGRHVGTALTHSEAADLAARVDLTELRAYWGQVGEQTKSAVQTMSTDVLEQMVGDERLKAATADGACSNPRAPWLAPFFTGHTGAWHLAFVNVHLVEHLIGEALAVRGQLGLSLGL